MIATIKRWLRLKPKPQPLSNWQRMALFTAMGVRFQRQVLGLPVEPVGDLVQRIMSTERVGGEK